MLERFDFAGRQNESGQSHSHPFVVKLDDSVKEEINQHEIYFGTMNVDWELLATAMSRFVDI